MDRVVAWLGSLGIGSALAVGVYTLLVPNVLLCTYIALFWILGIRLMIRHRYHMPGLARSVPGPSNWEAARWSGALAGLLSASAMFGVAPSLPISNDLSHALVLLVIGVGIMMSQLGMGMVIDADDEQDSSTVIENAA